MNPDCELQAGATARLQAQLEAHDACAIVAPRVLNPDGSLQGNARGDPDMLTGLFGRSSRLRALLPLLPAARRNVLTDEAIAHGASSVVVDWLSGACMLMRRSAFEAVGGFDAGYFMYWEDADLCRRLRERGYHVRYVPGASAVHRVGHSSRTARAASIRAFHDSAYRYYATHVAKGALKRGLARLLLRARCAWLLYRISSTS
jgi:GT2 family glycosyltransferase